MSTVDGTPKRSTDADGNEFCDVCGMPTLKTYEFAGKRYALAIECECEKKEREQREEKQREASKEQSRRVAFSNNGRYMSYTFYGDDGKASEESQKAKAYVKKFHAIRHETVNGLLFYGHPDQGKTFLACCIGNALIDAGHRVYMCSVPDLVGSALEWGEYVPSKYILCDLLILDDFGAERDTQYARESIQRVIDARAGKPIVATTNLTPDDLSAPRNDQFARLYNRLLEQCLPISVECGRRRVRRDAYKKMRGVICEGAGDGTE